MSIVEDSQEFEVKFVEQHRIWGEEVAGAAAPGAGSIDTPHTSHPPSTLHVKSVRDGDDDDDKARTRIYISLTCALPNP